jgi:hypothetical protein
MDSVNAIEFGREWEAAWNRRDVEAILKHFHEDAVFTSPVINQIGFAEDGTVNGKDALRRYWTAALAQNPDLRFQVTKVYQGTNTLVIAFHLVDEVTTVRAAIADADPSLIHSSAAQTSDKVIVAAWQTSSTILRLAAIAAAKHLPLWTTG